MKTIKIIFAGMLLTFAFGIPILLLYGIATNQTTPGQLITFIGLTCIACIIYKQHTETEQSETETKQSDYTIPKLDLIPIQETPIYTDPETEQKKQAALKEIETITTLINQYLDLYDVTEQALNNTYKEISRIRLQEKLINIECKIDKLEKQKDKAYYIAYRKEA